MGFYVVVDKDFPRQIIPEDEFNAYPYLNTHYQILTGNGQRPNGKQLVIRVPFGTGNEKIKVSKNENDTKIVVVVKSGDMVCGVVVSVGTPNQCIKVIPLTAKRWVRNDLFKSLLIELVFNKDQYLGIRPKRLAIESLISIIKSGEHNFTFTVEGDKTIKVFLDYRNQNVSLQIGRIKRKCHFNMLHSFSF